MIILSDSKAQLHEWKSIISNFLERELRLSLNQKTCIRPVSQGIEFVGYRIWPHYVTIRKSTTLQIKRAMIRKAYEYSIGMIALADITNTTRSRVNIATARNSGKPLCALWCLENMILRWRMKLRIIAKLWSAIYDLLLYIDGNSSKSLDEIHENLMSLR